MAENVKEEVPDWPESTTRIIEESTDGITNPVYVLDLDDEALDEALVKLKRVAAALSQPATTTLIASVQPAALASAAPQPLPLAVACPKFYGLDTDVIGKIAFMLVDFTNMTDLGTDEGACDRP